MKKSLRFSIFERDRFICKYCGRDSSSVALEVDHVIPRCEGGTDDPDNLVTSCFDCNRGKGGRLLQSAPEDGVDPEAMRLEVLAREQELHEIRARAEAVLSRKRFEDDRLQEFVNVVCDITDQKSFDTKTLRNLMRYADEFGPEMVFEWVRLAYDAIGGHDHIRIGKYVSGIRRRVLEQEGGEE